LTPEEETDALLDALGRGEDPQRVLQSMLHRGSVHHGHPAVRLLAALVTDVLDGDEGDLRRSSVFGGGGLGSSAIGDGDRAGSSVLGGVGQRRSSVSMTPST
jgi:hypothetical protein